MNTRVDARTLRAWLNDGDELALLDIREHGQYGEGHPFFAVHLPYSRLELDAPRLLPRRETRVVVFDDGDGVADRAASRLRAQGYGRVAVLDGGAPAWAAAGYTLFKGVNVPSKTFGELVEHAAGTPHVSAGELDARLRRGDPLVLLDGRTPEEHRKMTIPGALPVPNGELALRAAPLLADAATPIVVHCAGRTRSIIGAQTLRHLGLPNPVLALENGTQGWRLAGLELEYGSARALPAPISGEAASALASAARRYAGRAGAAELDAAAAQAWLDDAARTTYVLDVRTAEEYAAGTLAGAVHAPGGQLIQATDQWVAVRRARLLLLDDDGIRAPIVAAWLRQQGFEAATVAGGIRAPLRVAPAAPPALAPLPAIDAATLRARRDAGALLLDLRGSRAFRAGHLAGAHWATRARIADAAQAGAPVVLIADDEGSARLAAIDLREAGVAAIEWTPWSAARQSGLPSVATPDEPSDAQAIDFLLFVHDRHDGNLDAARRYLEWETGLIAQCAEDELAVFKPLAQA